MNPAVNWARGLSLPLREKVVLLILADRAREDLTCWPGIDLLVADTSMSQRSVQRAITGLVERGAISAERRGGRSRNTLYTVHMGAELAPFTRKERVPTSPERVPTETERVPDTPVKGAKYDIAYIEEPQEEPTREPTGTHSGRDLDLLGDDPKAQPVLVNGNLVAFEGWWKEYPAKRGGKGDARREYAKALKQPNVTNAGLLTALRAYPFDRREFPRFIPHASTWLHGGRYENATEAMPPAPIVRTQAEIRRANLFSVGLMPTMSDDRRGTTIDATFTEEFATWDH